MAAVTDRKRTIMQGLIDAHLALYKGRGAELIMGSGKFVAPKALEARHRRMRLWHPAEKYRSRTVDSRVAQFPHGEKELSAHALGA
jgi:hypothetical protein